MPMNRSFRHPFKGQGIFGTETARTKAARNPRQPRLRQSRFSVEAMLDVPDTSESRPSLRLRLVGVVMVGLFALLGLRLWALTALQAPAAAQAVVANAIRVVSVPPVRGLILDRSGNPLVTNVVAEQVTLSRQVVASDPGVVPALAAALDIPVAQINQAINNQNYSPYKPVPIVTDAPLSQVLYLEEHPTIFPGVDVEPTTERSYPQQEIPGPAQQGYPASQVLGFVTSINPTELKDRASQGYQPGDPFGQSGLEYQYERQLRGVAGKKYVSVDASGNVAGVVKVTPATSGDDVVTNIDTNLQQVADNALATQILALRKTTDPQCNNNAGCSPAATGGAVIVMSPQNGAVYAMSSYPSYNPEIWVGGLSTAQEAQLNSPASQEPLLNRAIQGLYPPGSTFKLDTATAALDDGLWGPNQYYYDSGSFQIPGCKTTTGSCTPLHNSEGDGGFGEINVSTALTVSSDDFFYNLGAQFYDQQSTYGPQPIQNTAAQYSLGELTGIDLPGEYQGRVASRAERLHLHAESPTGFPNTGWYTGDNVQMAFGQSDTVVTPIEQAVAYATFANGGTRYAPQVAAAITTPTGKIVQRIAPQVTGHVSLPPATYQALLAGFTGVVNNPRGTAYGTFKGLNFPGGIAGKTGTADAVNGEEPTAWFIGFGPTVDPQYVVVCVIDQAGFGATAAAPVVRDIYAYLAQHPVQPLALPLSPSVVHSTTPVSVPTPPTTPTTTSTTTTTTTPPPG